MNATIVGVGKLKPSNVSCPDLRGGAGLVLAGLVAKGETVVDVCSAPGGKSMTTAQLMENEGKIISCDKCYHSL